MDLVFSSNNLRVTFLEQNNEFAKIFGKRFIFWFQFELMGWFGTE
jgi:hypothetical protein